MEAPGEGGQEAREPSIKTPHVDTIAPQAEHHMDDAPDPDEDDLDDLDDILDEFSAAKPDSKSDAPTASGPGRPQELPSSFNAPTEEIPDDFNKQLQEQMTALMGEIDESPEMRQQMEAMMKELTAAGETFLQEDANATTSTSKGFDPSIPAAAVANSNSASSATGPEEGFQETIRRTMERMQASSTSVAAATATTASDGDDILAQMLKEMQGSGLEGAGEEDFSKMLMGMMEQLTNKEILYEPIKELHDKFPGWMRKNRGSCGAEDLARYEEQQKLVGEIVGRFERRGYSDEDAGDREFIVERMHKMQAAGNPPTDLIGGLKDAQEALGDLEAGCPQQ